MSEWRNGRLTVIMSTCVGHTAHEAGYSVHEVARAVGSGGVREGEREGGTKIL